MQGPTFPFPIFILPLKAKVFIPLLPFSIQLPMRKLPKKTLFFSNHGTLSMRQAILEESIVIESIGEELAISFALQVDDLSSVEGSIRHGGKLILLDVLPIIIAQILYLLAESSTLKLVHEIIGVYSIELALLGAYLTLTH